MRISTEPPSLSAVFCSKLRQELVMSLLGGGEIKEGEARQAACSAFPSSLPHVTGGPADTRTRTILPGSP